MHFSNICFAPISIIYDAFYSEFIFSRRYGNWRKLPSKNLFFFLWKKWMPSSNLNNNYHIRARKRSFAQRNKPSWARMKSRAIHPAVGCRWIRFLFIYYTQIHTRCTKTLRHKIITEHNNFPARYWWNWVPLRSVLFWRCSPFVQLQFTFAPNLTRIIDESRTHWCVADERRTMYRRQICSLAVRLALDFTFNTMLEYNKCVSFPICLRQSASTIAYTCFFLFGSFSFCFLHFILIAKHSDRSFLIKTNCYSYANAHRSKMI